ncbi:sensor histidine kinase [Cohnella candidum]|uniref:histidine kinase n=1 Tax=Cohnella candidum TaxID=2674991 RepID=A0A3G3JVE9_9BACL|nr:HAMP domain-containing sensor histidine kinase [Cohnella candidum]AYQ72223.1 sensor histidine kinase [Cohnella candidum]
MSIRTKLILSYAAMLFVPLILILLISAMLITAFQGSLQNVKALYEQTENMFDREDVGHAIHELDRTIARNPNAAPDAAYFREVGEELARTGTGLIWSRDSRIVYTSDPLTNVKGLTALLPSFRHAGYESRLPAVRIGNDYYVGSRYDFSSQGSRNSVYFWTRMDPIAYFARRYFPMLFTILLVILVATHAILTYVMSRTIIRPLRQLKTAASRIREGNLDFTVRVESKDEIGQLGIAFEDMRDQLQKSLALQRQYEANRKELISSISHDLKTPITAIRGYVDGLLEGVADTPEKSDKYIRTISAKADEMDRLIDELFLYAKLDLHRIPFSFETVPLAGFMKDWAEELHFEMDKRSIGFEPIFDIPSEASVLMDRDQFRRVLANVVANSIKYADKPDSRMSLRVFREGERAVIAWRDNGAGISQEALPHVFERFYRAEASRSTQTGGTGLGLAIAKQIMEEHGGSIEAQSEKGIGTTILIKLPLLGGEESGDTDGETHIAR